MKILLGQDIGENGGVFRVIDGLISRFGEHRVIDSPLAESAIIGAAVGMSINGLKPVAEIQFLFMRLWISWLVRQQECDLSRREDSMFPWSFVVHTVEELEFEPQTFIQIV